MSRAGDWGRRAGAVGAAVGAVAAGAAVGLVAERVSVGRAARGWPGRQPGHQPGAAPDELHWPEPGSPGGGRVQPVVASDGTRLHAEVHAEVHGEVHGRHDAAVTLVFSHGYCLSSLSWVFQRRDLADLGRAVFWDQRGHGRSAIGPPGNVGLDQLGRDLEAVLAACAPTGPLVLIGHSMGGMTIMSLAQQRPELFADRVLGVGLLATSAGGLPETAFGLPRLAGELMHRTVPWAMTAYSRLPGFLSAARAMGSDFAQAMTRRWSYASPVSPGLVQFTAEMIGGTPPEVVGAFLPELTGHDTTAGLAELNRGVETLVLVGDHDLLTPVQHSEAITAAVHGAELQVVPQAGHLVMLEHPEVVSAALRALVGRALRATGSPRGGPARRSRPTGPARGSRWVR